MCMCCLILHPPCQHAVTLFVAEYGTNKIIKERKEMNGIVWAFPVSAFSFVVPTVVSSITVQTKKKRNNELKKKQILICTADISFSLPFSWCLMLIPFACILSFARTYVSVSLANVHEHTFFFIHSYVDRTRILVSVYKAVCHHSFAQLEK